MDYLLQRDKPMTFYPTKMSQCNEGDSMLFSILLFLQEIPSNCSLTAAATKSTLISLALARLPFTSCLPSSSSGASYSESFITAEKMLVESGNNIDSNLNESLTNENRVNI